MTSNASSPQVEKVAEVARLHQPKAKADDKTRPGYRIWRDGCSGCEWISHDRNAEDHAAHVAQAAIDALGLTEEWTVEGGDDAAEDGWICAEITTTREEAAAWPVANEPDARVVTRLVTAWVDEGSE